MSSFAVFTVATFPHPLSKFYSLLKYLAHMMNIVNIYNLMNTDMCINACLSVSEALVVSNTLSFLINILNFYSDTTFSQLCNNTDISMFFMNCCVWYICDYPFLTSWQLFLFWYASIFHYLLLLGFISLYW